MAIIPHLGDEADPLAYEPDRLGRLGFGHRRRNRRHDPMGRMPRDERREAWRERWLLGASDDELFPDGPFRLKGRVGKDGENDREDVVKLESALARAGYYDAASTGGPTGYYGPQLEEAMQRFRADNGLAVNGTVKRADQTMRMLEQKVAQQIRPQTVISRESKAKPTDHKPSKNKIENAARRERLFGRVSIMPPPPLNEKKLNEFAHESKFNLRREDNGLSLLDPKSGKPIARMSEGIAKKLVQNWPIVSPRVEVLRLLFRTDLNDREKIEQADRLLPLVNERDFTGIAADWSKQSRHSQRIINREDRPKIEQARRAFRKAVQDLANGVAQEEVLPSMQKALFPELYRGGVLDEFLKDAMPGIGNARSGGHLRNDWIEFNDAAADGDNFGVAFHGILLLLDSLGIMPGVNVISAVARRGLKALPYAEAAIAQSRLNKAQRQFPKLPDEDENFGARKLLGPQYETLKKRTKESVNIALNWAIGNAANRRALEWMLNIDPHAAKPERVTMPLSYNGPGRYRDYDLTTRDLRTVFFDDVLRTRMWILGQKRPEPQPGSHYEIKSRRGEKSKGQELKDIYLRTNADAAAGTGVTDIREARLYLKQIPFDYIIEDATERLNSMVRKRTISKQVANDVMRALRKELAAGTTKVRPADYADLMVRLAASSLRTGEQLAPDFMGP